MPAPHRELLADGRLVLVRDDAPELLATELALAAELDPRWALVPVAIERSEGRARLLLDDPGGEPLGANLGVPWETGTFLRFAVRLAAALAGLHARGIVHRALDPDAVFVDLATGAAWLTGFGRASRRSRERHGVQASLILGRAVWLAPEQTGRANRSVDHRADLYSLGLVLYRVLTGAMPFGGEDEADWIANHVGRKPVPARARISNLPALLSDLLLRLLAKDPEDRYQTAASAERDLRRCLAAWEEHGTVEAFALSTGDAHARLLVSERVHGRDAELSALVAALDRAADAGRPRLVVVDAPAGTGKSAFVGELDRVLVVRDGLFVRGKADQLDAEVPLASIGRALADLGELLRVQHGARVAAWREAALAIPGLGALGALATALGPLPPAEGRVAPVLRRVLRVLAERLHPVVLFIDDLQWIDVATLELLEELLASGEGAILVVGAYRSGEASGTVARLARAARAEPLRITLEPLGVEDLAALVTDTVRREAMSLVGILHEKSGGNPFFAIQLLLAYEDAGLVAFSADDRAWHWDEARLRAEKTDIATLVAGRIRRLPDPARALVEELACLGATGAAAHLGLRLGLDEPEVHARLLGAVEANILRRDGATYAFVHDRVQEAAYGLLAPEERRARHLALGRALVAALPPAPTPEARALALGQLNRVVDAVTDPGERARLAELDLEAGRHALASMAYAAANDYLAHAWALDGTRDLARGLDLFASAKLAGRPAETLRLGLLAGAHDDRERSLVHALAIRLDTFANRLDAALDTARTALASLGISLDHVAPADLPLAELGALPLATDPRAEGAVAILAAALPAAWLGEAGLYERLALAGVKLLLAHGNTPRAPEIYAACAPLLDVARRFELAEMATDLAERIGDARSRSIVAQIRTGQVCFWRHELPDVRSVVDACLASGNLVHAGFASFTGAWQRFEAGDPLPEVQRLLAHFTALATETRGAAALEVLRAEADALAALVDGVPPAMPGETGTVTRALADVGALVRAVHEERLAEAPDFALPATLRAHPAELTYELHRGIATGDPAARERVARWAAESPRFRGRLELLDAENARRRGDTLRALRHYGAAIELARRDGPLPVEALACARLASLQRELGLERGLVATTLEAASAYRRWGALARAGELEALVEDRASDDFRRIRTAATLGAEEALALARRLDGELVPERVRERLVDIAREVTGAAVSLAGPSDPPVAMSVPIADEHGLLARLDLVAGDADRTAAGRGVLELLAPHAARTLRHALRYEALAAEAAARAASEATIARLQSILDESQRLSRTGSFAWRPEGTEYLHWSAEMNRIFGRGREDAAPSVAEMFQRIHPDDVAGVQEAVAYAEKHASVLSFTHRFVHDDGGSTNVHVLSRRVGTGDDAEYRGVAMDITEQQRAREALEKALGEVRRSQDRLRDIVDAIPALAWRMRPDGYIEFFNQRWLDYTGMKLAAAVGSGWLAAIHPDDRPLLEADYRRFVSDGLPPEALEFRLRRHDGAHRWFLLRIASLRDHAGAVSDWYGISTDIEDRKHAEHELQRAQADLARAARAVTLVELATSIAHEINQPLGAMVADANAGLNWLAAGDLDGARSSLEAIARDGERASDVVSRVRAHMARLATAFTETDLVTVVHAALEVVRPELDARGVVLEARLGEPLPVRVDASQIQQLVVQLVTNAAESAEGLAPGRREIAVHLRRQGRDVELVVEDAGRGLAVPASRLFDAFYTTKPGGLGLGLTISRSIVERHAGKLAIGPGAAHGTSVRVTLPVARL